MLNGKKIIAFCGKNAFFKEGRCFRETPTGFGEDLGSSRRELVRELAARGWICATPDQHPLESVDVFLFHDMPPKDNPAFRYACEHDRPRLLIVVENPLIDRSNAEYGRYEDFTQVLTFEDAAVAKYGCRKNNYAIDFQHRNQDSVPFESRKLAVMISSRVKKLRPGLVSYQRVQTIDFYERHHPEAFDLYGIGWEKGVCRTMVHPGLYRFLQSVRLAKLLPSSACRSWKGELERKLPTLAKYRFSYCYENTTCIPGYVTEKLFDVLRAGTVPIYLGAPESRELFPEHLYIDRSDFPDDEALYGYIASMDESEWRKYREVADRYLADEKLNYPFSVACHVQTVLAEIEKACSCRR